MKRPSQNTMELKATIKPILEEIRKKGDRAVRKFTKEFDGVELENMAATEAEFHLALNRIDSRLLEAIKTAASNITAFHKKQLQQAPPVETMPGVHCWRKAVAIEKVGLYVPGGTAPLFSTVLMLTIPAIIAGCQEIIICTPPDADGNIHPAILATANYIGVKKLFKVGGVQAIAAMSYGTETIPRVHKIFGPGNQYVTAAKQLVQQSGVAIDMPAGPSEVAIFADASANAEYVAADLLSQAEHGPDSQVLLVTDHEPLLQQVEEALARQLERLPRRALAEKALQHSKAVLVNSPEEGMELLNRFAPEHLILCCDAADSLADQVINAGSVFLGHYSPESAGDYASGTNHTLPTNGYARAYSGISVDSFVKQITFQRLSREGLQQIGETVQVMAEAEGLQAHAEAVRVRLKN